MKKIITFLGTNRYAETKYVYGNTMGKEGGVTSRFIQEAISEIVGKDATLCVGLTNNARKENWESREVQYQDKDPGERKNGSEVRIGLKEILEKKNIKYEEFSLKDGRTESEMWENFDSILKVLDEGDEVYIDVTNSFRSIPFIIMSIINYARFTKNIDIKGIYYGAFEPGKKELTPIYDLTLFNQLTDWTMGVEKFISTGDSKAISGMVESTIGSILKDSKGKDEGAAFARKIKNALKDFSGALHTARGNTISENALGLKGVLQSKDFSNLNVDDLKPFERILKRVSDMVSVYTGDTVWDIHASVKLCKELGLIQQGYTFLEENIINHFCIKGEYDLYDVRERELVKSVILSKHKKKNINLDEQGREVEKKIGQYINSDIAELVDSLGANYRNDINHAGFRDGPKEHHKFHEKLGEYIEKTERLILSNAKVNSGENTAKKMILVFSHTLTQKQRDDAQNSFGIEEFISLPENLQRLWGSIPPDKKDISKAMEKIKEFIFDNAKNGDYVLVQGDFGAAYHIVKYCKDIGLIPVYSTTKRDADERNREDGSTETVRIFNHVIFREY